jgi:hypothetical protein
MPDFLPYFERAAKGARTGLFAAVDNLAFVLNGFCRTPAMEYTDLTEASDPDYEPAYGSFCYGTVPLLDLSTPPDSAAVPPAVADEGPSGGDLAPPLSPGATNPTGHPTPHQRDLPPPQHLLRDGARAIELWLNGVPPNRYTRDEWQVHVVYMRQLAEDLEKSQK